MPPITGISSICTCCQGRGRVGILRGIEANIKNIDGEIDFPERYESRLDMIMAGFHEPVFPPRPGDPYPGRDQRHSRVVGST